MSNLQDIPLGVERTFYEGIHEFVAVISKEMAEHLAQSYQRENVIKIEREDFEKAAKHKCISILEKILKELKEDE